MNIPIENNVCCGFVEYGLYYVVVGSLNANFLEGFFFSLYVINGCLILLKAFSASIEMIIWFLSFKLLTRCITLIGLNIEESLHPWDKLYVVIVYDHFNMLLVSVC